MSNWRKRDPHYPGSGGIERHEITGGVANTRDMGRGYHITIMPFDRYRDGDRIMVTIRVSDHSEARDITNTVLGALNARDLAQPETTRKRVTMHAEWLLAGVNMPPGEYMIERVGDTDGDPAS